MNKRRSYFFIIILSLMMILPFSYKTCFAKNDNSISKKQYTITPKTGEYESPLKVSIRANNGYKIYYTTSSKFSVRKFVKSGKIKNLSFKKDTLLRVYYVSKNVSLSAKELNSELINKRAQKYKYYIRQESKNEDSDNQISEEGSYTFKEDVSLYIHTYGKLPNNFITKSEAKKLGWSGGGLDDYKNGYCIGGDTFSNFEGNLPSGNYHECDIDTLHKSSRGAKRIVYSDDGRIYYTEDHYDSFVQLY